MKGLQGNFMSEPRVFAHSARNITPSTNAIPLVDQRGVALYVGSGGNVVVRMEGTHMSPDPNGVMHETNINIFNNIPDGLFMPILVTHVLDNNEELWNQWENYYKDEIVKLEKAVEREKEIISDLKRQEEGLKGELREVQETFEDECGGGSQG